MPYPRRVPTLTRARARAAGILQNTVLGSGQVPVDPSLSTLVSSPTSITGDGVDDATVTLTAKDANDVAVAGVDAVWGATIGNVSASLTQVTATGTIEDNGTDVASVTVQVIDADGNAVPGLDASQVVIAVSGTGNTVTQPTGVTNVDGFISGSFVSTVPETKTVSATVRGRAITDTASVVVSGTPVEWPNLPSGYTELLDIIPDATYPTTANGTAENFTYQGGDFRRYPTGRSIGVAETTPSGSYSIRNRFDIGQTDGYSLQFDPGASPADTTKAYVGFVFKLNADFEGESTAGYKIFYPLFVTDGGSPLNDALALNLRSEPTSSTSSGEFKWQALQMQRYDGSTYRSFPLNQNANDAVYVPETWYRVEILMEIETPNAGNSAPSDGVLKVWTSEWNGSSWDASVLRISYTDVRYGANATTSRVFNDLKFQLFRGGTGTPTLSNNSDFSIARAYWATEV